MCSSDLLPQTNLSLHIVFHGNPGTGKTTVARIIARVYAAMAILDKGQLIETDRAGLVAEYAGQTAVKTNKKIDEAIDGVLFVDEAYSLVAEGGDDPYGHEAVQALLKRMEDDRARLVVILAGYPANMARLLGSNPGLSSRFSRHLTFADYTPAELGQIFHRMCMKNQYVVPPAARAKLLLGLQWLYDHRDEHFGNGRTVRNLSALSIRRLPNRIAHIRGDHTLDQLWEADINSTVYALALSQDGLVLYVGGNFTTINGVTRNYIAALDPATGQLDSWDPNANNTVRALAVSLDDATIYVGGIFSTIGGQNRSQIAEIDTSTGLATTWNPNANGAVYTLAVKDDGTSVYAAGSFSGIGNVTRYAIAELDVITGLATPWYANTSSGGWSPIYDMQLSHDGSTMYLAGGFTTMRGVARSRVAAVSVATGGVLPWNPSANSTVWSLAVSDDDSTIYASGQFGSIGGDSQRIVAALDAGKIGRAHV